MPETAPHGRAIAGIVLAAGRSTRMKSALPKVLHAVGGKPLLRHILDSLGELKPARVAVVVGKGMDIVAKAAAPAAIAIQDPPLGTGHAVLAAKDAMAGFDGDVFVLFADTSLIRGETMRRMLEPRAAGAAIVVLGFKPTDPAAYGRLVIGNDGGLDAIVEFKDATSAQRAINFVNSGVMLADARLLFELLAEVGNHNAQGEYYLTDVVGLARKRGLRCAAVEADAPELLGVDDRKRLADAEAEFQRRARLAAMAGGVTLADPATVWFAHDTRLGVDVTIGQNVVFGPGVTVEDNVVIKPFSHIEGAILRKGSIVGPFARIRPGSDIGEDVHIGNFVETKNAKIGRGAKANHLTYLGDAVVGATANIGAGTITCNYDGFDKHTTEIGEGAFIGSNTSLVAPVKVGAGAITGAGSVITKDIASDALAVERSDQKQVSGWAAKFRARKRAEKAAKAKAE